MSSLEWSRAPQEGIALGNIEFKGTLIGSDLAKAVLTKEECAIVTGRIETAAEMMRALAVAYTAIERTRRARSREE